MAKKDKAAKEEAVIEKEKEREFKYGVSDIAEKLGIKPASVRVQLRNRGIDKAGKSYGWDSKQDLADVIDQLKADKPEADDKPAKGKKGAKAEVEAEPEAPAKGKKDKKNKKAK